MAADHLTVQRQGRMSPPVHQCVLLTVVDKLHSTYIIPVFLLQQVNALYVFLGMNLNVIVVVINVLLMGPISLKDLGLARYNY